jgi:partitioning defective protein 3
MLLIVNENGCSLGISATPDAKNGGLFVHHVEPNSRADRGRLKKNDRIVEINGINLTQLSESSIEEILKKSLTASELRLRVIRHSQNSTNNTSWENKSDRRMGDKSGSEGAVAKVSPNRKVPGAQSMTSLQVANTRKLGHRIEITLKKGAHGLGFSVTTRDNPAGGHAPIYIKNILPKGAAVEDGRLKPGDRLLEVDGELMTGKTQTDVVGILRATKPDAIVKIVVSRQQELLAEEGMEREVCQNSSNVREIQANLPKPPSPIMPRRSSSSSRLAPGSNFGAGLATSASSTGINVKAHHAVHSRSKSEPRDDREVFVFHIPVYDTEKAGLGVSVKGKTGSPNGSHNSSHSTSSNSDGDLGIFIKSVLHGGAASRDGRLKMNDQLLSVNNVTLLGQSNAQAMDTLRKAMLNTDRKYPGIITLTVARKTALHNSSGDLSKTNSSNEVSPQKSRKGSLKNVQQATAAEPEMVLGGLGCKEIIDRKDSLNGSQRR